MNRTCLNTSARHMGIGAVLDRTDISAVDVVS
jgi:hypothetical protein